MYVAILGRQPKIGIAELERVYGNVRWLSDMTATVESDHFAVERLGGTLKAGRVIGEYSGDWRYVSMQLVKEYTAIWATFGGKLTLGISAYGFAVSARDVQKTGIILKQKLKANGVSLRLIPQDEPVLSTATSHHNKLGLSANKVELIVVRSRDGNIIVAESIGAQNISAYTRRDQERPKRDAFVGMLPPKLAQIMINLTGNVRTSAGELQPVLLDPFCGTGVILQEASLMKYAVYGTDLSEKMIRYSRDNLQWLQDEHKVHVNWYLHEGDAMTTKWRSPVDMVACETYLGQPFSAPPSPVKLAEVVKNCDHIIAEFLKNIGRQIQPGTPLCIAVPAWRDTVGNFTHVPVVSNLGTLGYKVVGFKTIKPEDLLYYREDQVVARKLLVLTKA